MKNILILLDYYLPYASANGICAEKIAKELKKQGHNVCIISCNENKGNTDFKNIDKIDVFYANYLYKQQKTTFSKVWRYAKWLLPSPLPTTQVKSRTQAIVNVAEKVIKQNNIDTVICIHLPIETLIAGTILKERFPSISYVAYMLDSLSGGFLPKFLPGEFCRKKKINWENDLLDNFDRIILMRSSKDHHEASSINSSWYKKSVYSDIPMLEAKSVSSLPKTSDKINMVFAGTLADGIRTPYHFLKLLSEVNNLDISFSYAGVNKCNNELLNAAVESCKEKSNLTITSLGLLKHSEAIDLIERSDFLINFGNTVPTMVPSKIFEYMSYRKPIISTYSIDNEPCLAYLRKYPCALLIDERETDLKAQAKLLEDFILQNRDAQITYDNIKTIFPENTPAAFVDALKDL